MHDTAKRNIIFITLGAFAAVLALFVFLTGGGLDPARVRTQLTNVKHPSEDADLLYTQARLRYQEGERHAAAVLARRITRIDPKHAGAHKLLAALALRARDFKTAEAECRQALSADPADRVANAGLGSALRGQGRRREAVVVYRGLLALAEKENDIAVRDEALLNLQQLEAEMKRLDPDYAPPPLPEGVAEGLPVSGGGGGAPVAALPEGGTTP